MVDKSRVPAGQRLRQNPPHRGEVRVSLDISIADIAREHIAKADLRRGVDLYVRLATDLLAREATP